MKILVTGNTGYVGSVLTEYLAKNLPNSELIGFDAGFFAHCLTAATRLPETNCKNQITGDTRNFKAEDLAGVDAIVHLAAVSNDPIGKEFEAATQDINREASVQLARFAAKAGVKNFVFASSCSMYGQATGGPRTEQDQTNPITAYAKSKIGTEEDLLQEDLGDMVVTNLRFATACGMSPRLRLDLVLNDFVACALTTGKITVLSDGSPWRPLIDVEDMARAIHWGITRSAANGGPSVAVNAGKNAHNYQVKDLADAVAAHVPSTTVSINKDAPPDNRSYKVDFSLFDSLAPDYTPQIDLPESIGRLVKGLSEMEFSENNFRQSEYIRLNMLRRHIEAGRLDWDLRWRK